MRVLLLTLLLLAAMAAKASTSGHFRIFGAAGQTLNHTLSKQPEEVGESFSFQANGRNTRNDQVYIEARVSRVSENTLEVQGTCRERSEQNGSTRNRSFFERFRAPREVLAICPGITLDIEQSSD